MWENYLGKSYIYNFCTFKIILIWTKFQKYCEAVEFMLGAVTVAFLHPSLPLHAAAVLQVPHFFPLFPPYEKYPSEEGPPWYVYAPRCGSQFPVSQTLNCHSPHPCSACHSPLHLTSDHTLSLQVHLPMAPFPHVHFPHIYKISTALISLGGLADDHPVPLRLSAVEKLF